MEAEHYKAGLFRYEKDKKGVIKTLARNYVLLSDDDQLVIHSAALKATSKCNLYRKMINELSYKVLSGDIDYDKDIAFYYDVNNLELNDVKMILKVKPSNTYKSNCMSKQIALAYKKQTGKEIQGHVFAEYVRVKPEKYGTKYYVLTNEKDLSEIQRIDMQYLKEDVIDKALDMLCLWHYKRDVINDVRKQKSIFDF